jgi:hypothetical protein
MFRSKKITKKNKTRSLRLRSKKVLCGGGNNFCKKITNKQMCKAKYNTNGCWWNEHPLSRIPPSCEEDPFWQP